MIVVKNDDQARGFRRSFHARDRRRGIGDPLQRSRGRDNVELRTEPQRCRVAALEPQVCQISMLSQRGRKKGLVPIDADYLPGCADCLSDACRNRAGTASDVKHR
jgi:hypothetical protein